MKKVLQRFVDVWKSDFLHKLTTSKEKTTNTTIWFWIIFSVIFSFTISFYIVFVVQKEISLMADEIFNNEVISKDAELTMKDGQLSTNEIQEPFVYSAEDKSFLLVIDTNKNKENDPEILNEYESGLILLKDKLYSKDNDNISYETVVYKNHEAPNFSVKFKEIEKYFNDYFFAGVIVLYIVVFVLIFLFLAIFRLLTALWWALLLFLICLIINNKISYGKSYEIILNFYFIVLPIELFSLFIEMNMPFSTFIIFSIIFSINLFHIKNNKSNKVEEDEIKESDKMEKLESKEETTEQV
ncbi:MAG: DUF1189 family protein [Candidatus Moranbacteria bacterium]|nr:DUF1189 family protein [Candidatus Moranbacteria bacterium]